MESPYDVLGLDPDADDEEVDRAYRRLVLETHPDRGGSSQAFQRVKTAYEAIKAGEYDGEVEPVREPATTDPQQAAVRVEYLDYDVLSDNGWGLSDDGLFERAADAGLGPIEYGQFEVRPDETLLEAAEHNGFTWPYACRGGACANCAVAVVEGDLAMPVDHILPKAMMDQGIRLSCNGVPTTDELRVVYNLKHRPDLDDLRLPPHRFERDQARR